jgi:hypothetical protein
LKKKRNGRHCEQERFSQENHHKRDDDTLNEELEILHDNTTLEMNPHTQSVMMRVTVAIRGR